MRRHNRAAALAALGWLCVALWSGAAWAALDFANSQISPVALTPAQLAAILNQTAPGRPYLDAYQQKTVDPSTGAPASLAPVKVVETHDPTHPYLGVFHNQVTARKFAAFAAYSTDLVKWHTLGAIDDTAAGDYASQPDIRILPDDSILYAEEYSPLHKRPQIRVRYYGNKGGHTGVQRFIAEPEMAPSLEKLLPNINESSKADGTPEFARIDYDGNIFKSAIDITHHYFNLGERDIQAIGRLKDFQTWSDSTETVINSLITKAGGNGKIGDRELFRVGATVYEVVEAQVHPASGNDFGAWRLFLINRTANTIQKLNPALAGGATSLGNPTISFINLPNGKPALVFTCFVFGQNSGMTPPGGHMYVYPLAP